jgi:hypothetical protein
MKNIKTISIRFNPLSAQAGKPVPPNSLGQIDGFLVEKHFCKRLQSSHQLSLLPWWEGVTYKTLNHSTPTLPFPIQREEKDLSSIVLT